MSTEFESLLAGRLAAGQEEAAGAVLEQAGQAEESRRRAFRDALELRLERHPEPVRAEELRALLRAAR